MSQRSTILQGWNHSVIEVHVHREITSIQSDILIFVNSTDPEAVELSYSDMKCLEPEEYLKSPVINFCLQ